MDYLVTRIQIRRGLQVDLPQPLKPGEFGWCIDTGRLYVGSEDNLPITASIAVEPGFSATVQSALSTQFLELDVSAISSFDINDFKSFLSDVSNLPNASSQISPTNPTLSISQIDYDENAKIVVIGFTSDQATATSSAPGTDSLTVGSSINEATDGYITDIISYDTNLNSSMISMASYVVDDNNMVVFPSYERANAYASILNFLFYPNFVAKTNLNVEVLTEFTPENKNKIINPLEYNLLPASVDTQFSPNRILFDVSKTNVIIGEYSIKFENGPLKHISTTSFKIVADQLTGVSVSTFNSTVAETQPLGAFTLNASFINVNTIELVYQHTFSGNIIFKYFTKGWHI